MKKDETLDQFIDNEDDELMDHEMESDDEKQISNEDICMDQQPSEVPIGKSTTHFCL